MFKALQAHVRARKYIWTQVNYVLLTGSGKIAVLLTYARLFAVQIGPATAVYSWSYLVWNGVFPNKLDDTLLLLKESAIPKLYKFYIFNDVFLFAGSFDLW